MINVDGSPCFQVITYKVTISDFSRGYHRLDIRHDYTDIRYFNKKHLIGKTHPPAIGAEENHPTRRRDRQRDASPSFRVRSAEV